MSTYTAPAHRQGDWWVVEVVGVGVTRAKRLDQVEDMARDMVALMEDVSVDDVHVEVAPQVGPELDGLILGARTATDAAKRAQAEATETSRTTARRLKDAGYSLRDIAVLTGVSYQRVHQLIGGTPVMTGASSGSRTHHNAVSGEYVARAATKAGRQSPIDA